MRKFTEKTRGTMAGLLAASLLLLPACSTDLPNNNEETTDAPTVTTDSVTTEPPLFSYPDTNFGGSVFRILNCSRMQWDMTAYITTNEITGEEVNDAIYRRQQKVQSELGCVIEEENVSIYDMKKTLELDILAQNHTYAAAYQRADETTGGILANWYYCLDDLKNLHLDKPYWLQDILAQTSLGGQHYFAASNLQLMNFDGVWCIFFNRDILRDHQITVPYEDVRQGTWTLDKLHTLSAQLCSLNGDASYAWNANGNAVYGYTTFRDGIPKLLYGIEACFGEKDFDDYPFLNAGSEGFINRCLTLADFCGDEGAYYYAAAGNENGYDTIFLKQRAAFVGAEIKFGQKLRAADFDYGILPHPKYDESQQSYHSTALNYLPVVTIPTSNTAPEEIALVLDALSYESDQYLLQPYYESRVSVKGIGGTQDDVDMLNIIKNTRGFDIFVVLGLNEDLRNQVSYNIGGGETTVASIIKAFQTSVNSAITKMNAQLRGLK